MYERLITGLELVAAHVFGYVRSSIQTKGPLTFILLLGATQPWPRRGHLQIIAQMLEIVSHEGATKTALVYKANLNFTLAHRYINYLESKGLMQGVEGSRARTYQLTAKGREALVLLRRAMDEVFEEQTMLN